MGVDFLWHGDSVTAALDSELLARLGRAADALVDATRSEAPSRTGRLRDSAHKAPPDHAARTVSVTVDAPYAGFVEDGTPRHPAPNPFLARAVEKAAPLMHEILSGRK